MMTLRSILQISILFAALALPLSASAQVSCGDTIPARTKVVLTADLGPCSVATGTSALILEGGAQLDLAGFTVSCDAGGAPARGIYAIGKGAKLKNGVVSGCPTNVFLGDEGRHKVDAVVAIGGGGGFSIPSDGNKIKLSSAANGAGEGFYLGGDKNSVKDSVSSGSGGNGFDIQGDGNKLSNTSAFDSTLSGVHISGDKNQVSKGSFVGNDDDGILITLGSANQIKQVNASANTVRGVVIFFAADNTKVQRSTILSNGMVDAATSAPNCGSHVFKNNVIGTNAGAGNPSACFD